LWYRAPDITDFVLPRQEEDLKRDIAEHAREAIHILNALWPEDTHLKTNFPTDGLENLKALGLKARAEFQVIISETQDEAPDRRKLKRSFSVVNQFRRTIKIFIEKAIEKLAEKIIEASLIVVLPMMITLLHYVGALTRQLARWLGLG
jgi:hypothetical protein